jgi:hypothetical protein
MDVADPLPLAADGIDEHYGVTLAHWDGHGAAMPTPAAQAGLRRFAPSQEQSAEDLHHKAMVCGLRLMLMDC